MRRRDQDLLDKRVSEVLDLIRVRFGDDAGGVCSFTRSYFADVIVEDVEHETIENLYGAVASLWQFLKQRKSAGPKIRVYNPDLEQDGWQSTHTAIEIVNDDMPFLVDSVVSALNVMALPVLNLVHPIIHVTRSDTGLVEALATGDEATDGMAAESVLHVEITQQPGGDRHNEIEARLNEVLGSVSASVEDWHQMMAELEAQIDELRASPPPVAEEDFTEGLDFLEWLQNNHFTFLGHREYVYDRRDDGVYAEIVVDKNLGILREVSEESRKRHGEALPDHFASYIERKELFIISKAWTRSDVHRPVYMDYIGVRRFDGDGNVVGERRFLGLLTSTAYSALPAQIPLLRRKVATVIERSGYPHGSHNAKALEHILDTYPRDELFQIDIDTLEEITHGILHLEHRQRIRLFMRRDSYGQFVTCLVFVPRDRYTTDLRTRMEHILLEELGGSSVDVTTQISDAPMARAQFIVHTPGGSAAEVDVRAIEGRLVAASRDWNDDLQDALIDEFGEGQGMVLYHRYAEGIPASYKDSFSARLAVADIERMEKMGEGINMNLYRRVDAEEGMLNFKIYHGGNPVPLSSIMPMLEHMGLVVIEETPFEIRLDDGEIVWIHDFHVNLEFDWEVDVSEARQRFHETFARVWSGEIEDDDFNDLVLAGLDWRQVVVLRAYAKYMTQANAPFSQTYVEQTLAANPVIARLLVELFMIRFDPDNRADVEGRSAAVQERIAAALDEVASLDQDRILRRYLNLIEASLRTNFFQTGEDGGPKSYVSFKFDSTTIEGLPEPRPWREIFVYSSRVEAVHLRGGPVARGGIRWSDRREDFRTEVLGLVKAQMVKNAVIVPVGSKGGFVVKKPPTEGGREAFQAEGIACYQTFMAGMLDITDNIVGGEIVQRERAVRYDSDDPYLVVAADKGTATFSDIANGVARDYGHWLDDAFASGGSAGYDHKAMGITAKGAWEAVKRHFRELGKDIQSQDFTVIGVGDMMGDVFGNGMLLSEHIRLLGAFNHLHIFCDPDPDAATSYAERKRMLELPRSSWTDYDASLISEGGAIFERSAKSLTLSPQIQSCFGIKKETVTPTELINAMLKADVELLWNGGIGTYFKAGHESHAEVGDRANDGLRVDGREVGAKVVGEGGNLGATQAGRIEYALAGGRINTDAIDNSAGVDCSDHEVNIKILLGDVVEAGDMTIKQRDRLLEEMTDEVSDLVLRDNYLQTQTLTVLETHGVTRTDEQAHFMRAIEQAGLLDRTIEGLPEDEELADWATKRRRFTRPELSVLLAYAKMDLYPALLDSDLPDDPDLEGDLVRYFPVPLQETFHQIIMNHRLRREIVATFTTNSIVNRAGITFIRRMAEQTGHGFAAIARAYAVARDAFGLRDTWLAIEALDNKVPASVQTAMLEETMLLIERVTAWMLRNRSQPMAMGETVAAYRPAVVALQEKLPELVSTRRRQSMQRAAKRYEKDGVPAETAALIASLRTMSAVCDVIDTAEAMEVDVIDVATIFFDVGEELGNEWLRDMLGRLAVEDRWDRLAQQALIEESFQQQTLLTTAVLEAQSGKSADKAVGHWIGDNRTRVDRASAVLNELKSAGPVDLAMVSVASRALRSLAG
ncbi:MAG: NAD-glutamate dehydrogenase [Rhodospirillaceae bacterium]|nr:NAD-glutamate dehydrogenase [Rhodospirillaceae bacterium]|tara:strand:+ start:50647 stop:55461 length:4815 start_codon:yes stop_codon:yes gene_type:complete